MRKTYAYIFQLFRAPVQAAVGELPLSKPPPERRHVDHIQPVKDRKRRRAHPHCQKKKECQQTISLRSAFSRGVKALRKRGKEMWGLARTLCGMALGTCDAPKSTVKVAA
jgi:hypothetical protein